MKHTHKLLQDLKAQYAASPWLKWAALFSLTLIGVYGLLALDVVRQNRQKQAIQGEQNLRRVLRLNGQEVWLKREEQARATVSALKAEIPETATQGLAQASLQNWIRQATSTLSQQESLRVSVNEPIASEVDEHILRVTASISGNISPRESLDLMRKIETNSNLTVVDTFVIQSDANSILQLTMTGYYRITDRTAQ